MQTNQHTTMQCPKDGAEMRRAGWGIRKGGRAQKWQCRVCGFVLMEQLAQPSAPTASQTEKEPDKMCLALMVVDKCTHVNG